MGEVAAAAFLVAVVYVLVRPGSKGPTFVSAFGQALTSLISTITATTDGGGDDENADDESGN